ncbi:MAG: SRPBCC domain-containing protein [Ignavibacteria bacterium]
MSDPKSDASKRELVIERIFEAPPEMVWRAWTDPENMKKWWGPKDFTCPSCRIDFKVGGKCLFCMLSNEGKEYWSTGTYNEIIPLKKIVCTDSFSDKDGNVIPASELGMPGKDWPLEMYVTVTFEDLGGKTKMTLKHVGIPGAEMSDMTGAGWNQSFDKLAESLK